MTTGAERTCNNKLKCNMTGGISAVEHSWDFGACIHSAWFPLGFSKTMGDPRNKLCSSLKGVVAEWIRTPNSSSGASVQQSVGSNPGRGTCVPEQDT